MIRGQAGGIDLAPELLVIVARLLLLCLVGVTQTAVASADDDRPVKRKRGRADVEVDTNRPVKRTKRRPASEHEEDDAPRRERARRDVDESDDDEVDVARIEPDEDEPADEVIVVAAPKRRPKRELYFRAGMSHIQPRTKSSGMQLEPVGIAALMPMDPPQGGIVTDPANVFTAIIGFAPATFHGYLAFETMLGIPRASKLRATGDLATKSLAPTALDLVPTGVPPLGEEIGEANAAPLMVTAVARTGEIGGRVRLYAGGGPVVLFARGKVTNEVLTEVATPKIETDPALGFVLQAGIDIRLFKSVFARFDVKEMWFQPTETRITNIHVKTTIPLLETVEVGSARSQLQANPIALNFGVGASF